ncbi:hypothetical protein T4D_689 [Trichinella pseudospiralis]|uniref:Uncharacterized protein n=1 Tax=Trichinella pseudospiralis TaxID=6337 RepID=A0A0V1DMJ4_TRIPS|nr:hypothetical protein T4D_689 [Trichinella pseudospiralis]
MTSDDSGQWTAVTWTGLMGRGCGCRRSFLLVGIGGDMSHCHLGKWRQG